MASSLSCIDSETGTCAPIPGSPDGLNVSQAPNNTAILQRVNLTLSRTADDTPEVLFNDITGTPSFSTAEQYAFCYDSRYGALYIAASDGMVRVSPLKQGQRTMLTDAGAAGKTLAGYVGESRMTPTTLNFTTCPRSQL